MLKYVAVTLMFVSVIELQLLHEYEYLAEMKNWHQAIEYCNGKGMKLLDIDSDEEYNRTISAIKSQSIECVWTSGNDIENEGIWVWNSTGDKITNTHWYGGNPDNYLGEEHCLQLRKGKFYYNDVDCISECHVMCEKKTKTFRWIIALD